MTIRFAAASHVQNSILTRFVSTSASLKAVNDNSLHAPCDAVVTDALRHFAKHGLGAAASARQNAQDALQVGDRENYGYWFEICRLLDRRMAAGIDMEIADAV